jgi:hypothetical protein
VSRNFIYCCKNNPISQIAKEFAKNNNMIYIETSAKNGINVDTVFDEVVDLLYKNNAHIIEKQIKPKNIKSINYQNNSNCCGK